ncbi:MAG: AI-2E family transporter [Ardenticatenaceae bacterium]|nr:AI-2E family transporter [Ardenticatenaceae bacterium]
MSTIPPEHHHESPLWNRAVKISVAIGFLLLAALLAQRFQSLIGQIVAAAIVAYILNPIIIFLDKNLKIKRGSVLIVVYLLLAAGMIWAFTALGVAAFQQVTTFINLIPNLISDVVTFVQGLTIRTEPIVIGTFTIDPAIIPWETITNQLLGLVEPVLGQGGQIIRQLASTTVRWMGISFFVFMISIYIANEIPRLGSYVSRIAQQPGYQHDAERLMREFGRIWSAYLRGQVILGLVIFLVVWLGLAILGVQNALALGLLAGLLEFIPTIGPVVSAGISITVAFFQPVNYFGVPGWQYALFVLGFMFLVQQLENSILVPRIMGQALDLHALIVIVGVYMGGSLAGILGAVLAAPVIASLKLLGIYAWRKMFDLYPFPQPEKIPPPKPGWREQIKGLLARVLQLFKRRSR